MVLRLGCRGATRSVFRGVGLVYDSLRNFTEKSFELNNYRKAFVELELADQLKIYQMASDLYLNPPTGVE